MPLEAPSEGALVFCFLDAGSEDEEEEEEDDEDADNAADGTETAAGSVEAVRDRLNTTDGFAPCLLMEFLFTAKSNRCSVYSNVNQINWGSASTNWSELRFWHRNLVPGGYSPCFLSDGVCSHTRQISFES